MTTIELLANLGRNKELGFRVFLASDGTYRLTREKIPLIICGTVDAKKKTHALTFSLCRSEDQAHQETVLSFTLKAAAIVAGMSNERMLESITIMLDNNDASQNAVDELAREAQQTSAKELVQNKKKLSKKARSKLEALAKKNVCSLEIGKKLVDEIIRVSQEGVVKTSDTGVAIAEEGVDCCIGACAVHFIRRAKLRILNDRDNKREFIDDCIKLTRATIENGYPNLVAAFKQKWTKKGEPEAVRWFCNEYDGPRKGNIAHATVGRGIPNTDNNLEGFNNAVKVTVTQWKLLPLMEFLNKLEDFMGVTSYLTKFSSWSDYVNDLSYNELWLPSQELVRERAFEFHLRVDRDCYVILNDHLRRKWRQFVTAAEESQGKNTFKDVNRSFEEWKSEVTKKMRQFAAFCKTGDTSGFDFDSLTDLTGQFRMVCQVANERDFPGPSTTYTCTCRVASLRYICKHSLGFAINEKSVTVPSNCSAENNGWAKTGRGRPTNESVMAVRGDSLVKPGDDAKPNTSAKKKSKLSSNDKKKKKSDSKKSRKHKKAKKDKKEKKD